MNTIGSGGLATATAEAVQGAPHATEIDQTRAASVSRNSIMVLFALVYAVEGLCEPRGLIGQPFMHFAKDGLGWTTTKLSAVLALFALPWILKPIFGVMSDGVPLFRYGRRAYLIGGNALACVGYALLAATTAFPFSMYALLGIFFAMAISSTACGGLLVEIGQTTKISHLLVNQQWLWLSIAGIISSATGGWIAQHFSPGGALRASAAILLMAPLAAIAGVSRIATERRTRFDRDKLRQIATNLSSIFSGRFVLPAAFLFFFMFSPGFYVPLYYRMTDDLHFSQQFIGTLGSISAIGSVAGALIHRYAFRKLTMKTMTNLALVLGVGSTLSYLLLQGSVSAIAINFASGSISTLTIIVAATLAADFTPPGSEGFGYSLLALVENLAMRLSDISGSYLYDGYFSHRFWPLVLISAATTAVVLLLVPLLRLGAANQGEPAWSRQYA